MLIENNLRENILEAEAYALAERNLSFEDSYVFELQQVYRHTDFRLHRTSVQVGKTIRPYSFELVSPPSGARLLWRVILLPEGDTFGHSRGFTLTPSSYVLPLITQSSTGQSFFSKIKSRATGRNRHMMKSNCAINPMRGSIWSSQTQTTSPSDLSSYIKCKNPKITPQIKTIKM